MLELKWILVGITLLSLIFIWIGISPNMGLETPRKKYRGKPPPHWRFHLEEPTQWSPRLAGLKKDLELLNRKKPPQQVLSRLWIFGSLTFIAGVALWLWSFQFRWILLGGIVSSIGIYWPVRRIHHQAQRIREKYNHDLPLLQLGVIQRMLAGQSPYNAIVEASQSLSGPLRQEIHRLIMDMNMTGDVDSAWKRWAKRVDSPQMLHFAGLLSQTMTVNTVGMERQLRAVYQALRREHQEAWKKKLQQLPGRLQWPNLILFANMVILPVVGVGLGFSQVFHTF